MQGRKRFTPKLFTQFNLAEIVPESDFYRKLDRAVDFSFLYPLTQPYYSESGQPSLDPVVFFKLLLFGYFENIPSERKIVQDAAMRLNVRLFIGYDIDEVLPWHSTLSKTRSRLPVEVFERVFEQILGLCVQAGFVDGKTQSIDSALIKANASLDSLVRKGVMRAPAKYLNEVSEELEEPTEKQSDELPSPPKVIHSQADSESPKKELGYHNSTHFSKSDPDARIKTKRNKPVALYHFATLAVDGANHFITHIQADFADKSDHGLLIPVVDRLRLRLARLGLLIRRILADRGYSNGLNYLELEKRYLEAFIPLHQNYQSQPKGFEYSEENDHYQCAQKEVLSYRSTYPDGYGNLRKSYRTSASQCRPCPIRSKCIKKKNVGHKEINVTAHRNEYERMKVRMASAEGKRMSRKRASTVEPVFGNLIHHRGMRKIFSKGNSNAQKTMLMAAVAHNLKKYLKFSSRPKRTPITQFNSLKRRLSALNLQWSLLIRNLQFLPFNLS